MIKHFFTSLLLLLITAGFCFSQEFDFKDDKIRFSEVEEGKQLDFNFIFTNTGDQPLIIHSYDVNCSCTSATLPAAPVPPGQQDTVKVSFDTRLKIGWQQREVTLYSNAGKYILEFRGKVQATEATKKKYKKLKEQQ